MKVVGEGRERELGAPAREENCFYSFNEIQQTNFNFIRRSLSRHFEDSQAPVE